MLEGLIKKGTVVRVAPLADLPEDRRHLRNSLGLVVEDSRPETVVLVDLREGKTEQLPRDVLTVHMSPDDPRWTEAGAKSSVARSKQWRNPEARAKLTAWTPERRAKLSTNLSKTWTPERRTKHSATFSTYSPEIRERITALLKEQSLKQSEIAKQLGIHVNIVGNVKAQLGLTMQKRVDPNTAAKILAALREEDQQQYRSRKGSAIALIAAQFGVNEGVVQVIQNKAGIRFRKKNWRSFQDAREWARAQKFANQYEWKHSKLPNDLPFTPEGVYAKKGWQGWNDFLGTTLWTKDAIIAFLKDIQSFLPELSDADVVKLLREAGLQWRLGNLRSNEGLAGILTSLRRGELPDISADDTKLVDEGIHESDYVSPEPEPEPHLPDKLKLLRASERTIQFAKESQLLNLRAKWFRDGVAPRIQDESGELFQEIKKEFEAEVTAVESLATPWWNLRKQGVLLPPSPMQKYVAWKLKTERVLGNWSGTGAGKTDSAGLASYVIDSKLTAVLAANSTLPGWKQQLEETFPGSKVFSRWEDVEYGPGCFLVLNYEKFQTEQNDLAQKIIALKPDMVVLDEIQLIKQRQGEASNRSMTIRDMLTELPDAYLLGMTATPVINDLKEGISLMEAIKRKRIELKTKATINNALDLFAELRRMGVRYIPRYEQTEEKTILSERHDELWDDILRAKDILPIERVLLPAKLKQVKDKILPGTVLYLEYVEGLLEQTRAYVQSLGYTVGEYVGETDSEEREAIKQKFIAGAIDVLIGSRAISVGVDGLQHRAKRLILLSLPWTHAAYQQIVGRVYRQGGTGNVEVVVPQVIVGNDGSTWSWDKMRFQRIEYKRTLGDCAVDGVIPTSAFGENRLELLRKAQQALNKLSKKMNK